MIHNSRLNKFATMIKSGSGSHNKGQLYEFKDKKKDKSKSVEKDLI